jgi:riboflavin biosynthesis pyrimidine reductase
VTGRPYTLLSCAVSVDGCLDDASAERLVLSGPERKVATLLVEGGARILRDVLADDLADELRLAVAPFFVGDPAAPRFGLPAAYPHSPADPMALAEVRHLGDVAVLHYWLNGRARPSGLPPFVP